MAKNAQIDILTVGGQGNGPVANFIANNGKLDIGRMRPFIDMKTGRAYCSVYKGGDPKKLTSYSVIPLTNATLRRDEWKQLDDVLVDVARARLGGIQDLIDKGLTFNLGNAMGTTVLEWHDVGDAMKAEVTMDGITRGKGDRLNFQYNYLPIPIVHVDYEINARALAASRNLGNPLDTTSAERAGRKVVEELETMLFTNTTFSFGELDTRNHNTIYSYLNHPDRNQVLIGTHWDNLTTTIGATIVNQVLAMKQAAISVHRYGPYMLYIPTAYETIIDQDYSDSLTVGSTNTIRERILKISNISGIKVIDTLLADNVLLVQMTRDVVRLVRGMGLTNIQWGEEGNMVTKFKVLTIQVPQIRSDQNLSSGIVHLA